MNEHSSIGFRRSFQSFFECKSKQNPVHLLSGWYEDDWFTIDNETSCTAEQLKIAAEGHITTEAVMWNEDRDQTTISGMVIDRYL